jgi:hypothetical protein
MVGYIGPIKKPENAGTTLLADIAPPTTSAEKTQVLASGKVAFGSGLGAGQYVIYAPIVRDGDPMLPASAAMPALGSILSKEGGAVAVVDPASLQQQPGSQLVSSNPAAASIIQLSVEGLFGVVQYRETPSTQYALKLQQMCYGDLVLDWSSLGGLWRSSQAVTTPWSTQLGGEGTEPDARAFLSASKRGDVYGFEHSVVLFMRYFNKYIPGMTVDDGTTSIKPYRYGFATETAINADGTAALNKRLVMGRFAHEGFAVMPDARTVYMTEQRHNGGLYTVCGGQGQRPECPLARCTPPSCSSWTTARAACSRCPGSGWPRRLRPTSQPRWPPPSLMTSLMWWCWRPVTTCALTPPSRRWPQTLVWSASS